jgi:carbamoyl-phosphate synthase small subunit
MTEALLVLEDGSTFRGRAVGADGEAFGEAVFNTAMCGYQEVLTDPSYSGQIVTMTSPHQGNYGLNGDDPESDRIRVAGFVVREASRRPSSWRSEGSLSDALAEAGVVGIDDVDTRRLTLRIRSAGAMRAGLSTRDLDPASLLERVREQAGMKGADLAASASTDHPYEAEAVVGPAIPVDGRTYRVAAYDFGMKRNILRLLAAGGCQATVFPARTPPEEILGEGFDGVFLSNGPGDPAATRYGVAAAAALLGKVPIFGICLGHQLLALALGGRTYKMKFGHRGVNQPVKELETGRIEISSHNHGFAVDADGWGDDEAAADGAAAELRWPGRTREAPDAPSGGAPGRQQAPPLVQTPFGPVALTHWNLNDGTMEGLRCLGVPAFSVQYHPEAAPGPHDSRHLFARFRQLMENG